MPGDDGVATSRRSDSLCDFAHTLTRIGGLHACVDSRNHPMERHGHARRCAKHRLQWLGIPGFAYDGLTFGPSHVSVRVVAC